MTLKFGKGDEGAQKIKSTGDNTPQIKSQEDVNHLNPIMKTFRVVLTACFLITLGHKWNGNKFALMLMPCKSFLHANLL